MKPSKIYLQQEMERYLSAMPDATQEEIADLKAWVLAGNDPYCNPSHIADEYGREMPFIHGLRAEQERFEAAEEQLMESPKPIAESDLF